VTINEGFAKQKDEEDITDTLPLEEAVKLSPNDRLQQNIGKGVLKKHIYPLKVFWK